MIELVSPGNKSSRAEFRAFVDKSVALIRARVHLLAIDPFPPTPRDPNGLHHAIWSEIEGAGFDPPPGQPLTQAAYAAGEVKEAYVEPFAVGDPLTDMPLFLTPERYVPVPLEPTYWAAWETVPREIQRRLG